MRLKHFIAPLAIAALLTACSQVPPPAPPDNSAAAVQGIRDALAASTKAFDARDFEAFVNGLYSDDASIFVPGAPLATGRPAILAALKAAAADPNLAVTINTAKIEASTAGDYGYAQGTVVQKGTDAKTKKVVEMRGKWVTVFKKQADGSWKAVADIYNFDAPSRPGTH